MPFMAEPGSMTLKSQINRVAAGCRKRLIVHHRTQAVRHRIADKAEKGCTRINHFGFRFVFWTVRPSAMMAVKNIPQTVIAQRTVVFLQQTVYDFFFRVCGRLSECRPVS